MAKARVSQTVGTYYYSYTLNSSTSSAQRAWEFSVFNVSYFDSLRNALGWDVGISIIPSQRITWAASDSIYDVNPGGIVGGFVIVSRGLPSIKDFYARGFVEVPAIDVEPDSIVGGDFPENSFHGITIGPTTPPAQFSPLTFLDTLNSFVAQSRSLSWITTQPAADKYSGLFTRIRTDVSQFNLKVARTRIDTVLQQVKIDSSSTLTSEAYALIRFNTEYLREQLKPANQVKAGIFNPTGGTISVKAKPSVAFGSGDGLKCMEATIRWLTSYNITLGTVSSPVYGFAKDGSVTNVGSYSYQKFRTTTSQTLSWASGTEYELFTVPVSGYCGIENFELTNALSGGEWFVDINYLDKTDSTFYHGTAQGIAYQNKSTSSLASWYDGQRHLARGGTKLHEVFTSGGEIIYRRSSNSGSTWDVTTKLSTGNGNNTAPCITAGSSNRVYVVWQRASGSNDSVCFVRSTDNGATWGSATAIVTGLTPPSGSENASLYPVIAEWNASKVVTVWATNGGLASKVSTNGGSTWASASVPLGGHDSYDQYLSLASISNYLMLTYDTRYWGVCSRTYDASGWDDEVTASSGTGTIYDRYSSVAGNNENNPIAAWCAQKTGQSEYRIIFRLGYSDNTWGWFVEFSKSTGISDYHPAITCMADWMEIPYCRSNNEVRAQEYDLSGEKWKSYSWSSSGWFPNITLENSSSYQSVSVWTNLSGPPYAVELRTSSGGGGTMRATGAGGPTEELHRRVVLESTVDHSRLTYELSALKLVTSSNDTVLVPFKTHRFGDKVTPTLDSVWEYLGTDKYTVPTNARTLLVDVSIEAAGAPDTTGKATAGSFTSKSFKVDLIKGTQVTSLVSDPTGTSGMKEMSVASYAGQEVVIRPSGGIPASQAQKVTVGVGDVHAEKSK